MEPGPLASTVLDPRFLLSFAAAFGIAYYFVNSRNKGNLPPYPWMCVPVIGNVIQLSMAKKRSFELFYETAKTKAYNKVFMLQLGSIHAAILNHVDVVTEALTKRQNDFAGRPQLYSLDLISKGGQDIVMADFGPKWKSQRKLAHAAMRAYASGKHLESSLYSSIEKTIEAMLKEDGKPFHVRPHITLLIFNLYAGILFGKEYDLADEEFTAFINVTTEVTTALGSGLLPDFLPILKYLPSSSEAKMVKLIDVYMNFLRARVAEHEERYDPKNINDLTDFVIQSLKDADQDEDAEVKDNISQDYVVFTVFDIMGAAIDTMVTTLHFAMGMMAAHPDVQAKCQAEIQQVIGSRLPAVSDRKNLPYTEATLYEIMRAGTMAVLGVPLATTCDTTVGGYDLPKGTMVMINIWALHNDSEFWDEPSEFRPERFLDSSGKLAPRPASFMPFSAGRRVCLGEAMAKTQLMVILPTLLQRLTVQPPEGQKVVIEYMDSGIANLPKPFDVVIKARE